MTAISFWAPELGQLALLLAALAGGLLLLTPLLRSAMSAAGLTPFGQMSPAGFAGAQTAGLASMHLQGLAGVQLAGCIAAFISLEISLLSDDFSVAYVQAHSHTDLPLLYKFAALWGAHEGSLLLWLLLLALWAWLAPSNAESRLPARSVLGGICSSFALFTLLTSNPFARLLPLSPQQGADLNPVLQHPALAVHPPILYAGYTAMAIVFALALQQLAQPQQRFSKEQASRFYSWVLIPLGLLTAGIALGSWWAYQELGWGGWWFWDPVENLSVLPWLCAVALLHALQVARRRGSDYGWCLLLAVLGFPVAVFGAFIVRSGLLVSVHSFSSDPQRGVFLLLLLCLISAPAIAMLARVPAGHRAPRPLLSRELLLLVSGGVMMLTAAIIALGTLYPLLYEAVVGERAAVGAPYYETVLMPLFVVAAAAMLLAPLSRWNAAPRLEKKRIVMGVASVFIGGIAPFVFVGTAAWGQPQVWLCSLFSALLAGIFGLSLAAAVIGDDGLRRSWRLHWRMLLAHGGAVLLALGALWQGSLGVQREVLLSVGQRLPTPVGELLFERVQSGSGANYSTQRASFLLDGAEELRLFPEKRFYPAKAQVLSEAAIARVGLGDLYLNLGEQRDDQSWPLRMHYKPLIGLIWLGAAIVSLGLLLMAAIGLRAGGGRLNSEGTNV